MWMGFVRVVVRVVLVGGFGVGLFAVFPVVGVACPNEAVRTGASASLPDCRAYELVSPPGSDGRLLEPLNPLHANDAFPTDLLSDGGDSFLLATSNAGLGELAGANGSLDVYEVVRTASGWSTVRRLSPSGSQGVLPDSSGVSAEHSYMFVNVAPVEGTSGGTLAGSAGSDYVSEPGGSFEETGIGSLGSEPRAQGHFISAGGKHVIFSTGNGPAQDLWCREGCAARQLEPEAPLTGTGAIYDREIGGPTRVVSLLPGDVTPAAGQAAEYQGTSVGGSAVAFKIGGVLYVRVDDAKTEEVTSAQAVFAGLSADGEQLFFVRGETGTGGDIEVFDTATETTTQVDASADARVVNIPAEGSRVYFVSPSLLGGSGGVAGQPNLYVWSASDDRTEYIATVAPSDLEITSVPSSALANWTGWVVNPVQGALGSGPGAESSRTTPSGSFLLFESRAKLTAYENAGHIEIYRYDAEAHTLVCVSCNPAGTPATADAELENFRSVPPPIVIENLSEDGSRVVFETSEALVSADTDGTNDVYEWEEGAGGVPTVALISSGSSSVYPSLPKREVSYVPQQNMLLAVSPNGSDIVFSASEQLVPEAGAGGTQGIYDARVDGGFPAPEVPVPCEGAEECRPAGSSPPLLQAPVSVTFSGSGNLAPSVPVSVAVKPAAKPLRRAQRLAKALRACRKDKAKAKRAKCEERARARYGLKAENKRSQKRSR